MARYFFGFGEDPPADQEGEELPDDATALKIAAETARELARNNGACTGLRVVVTNERGEVV